MSEDSYNVFKYIRINKYFLKKRISCKSWSPGHRVQSQMALTMIAERMVLEGERVGQRRGRLDGGGGSGSLFSLSFSVFVLFCF